MFFRKKVNELEIFKCAQGDIVPIENVPDSVFADKLLGDGIAINPSNGEIISPVDGQVVMIQDSLHAIGIQSEDGCDFPVDLFRSLICSAQIGYFPFDYFRSWI